MDRKQDDPGNWGMGPYLPQENKRRKWSVADTAALFCYVVVSICCSGIVLTILATCFRQD